MQDRSPQTGLRAISTRFSTAPSPVVWARVAEAPAEAAARTDATAVPVRTAAAAETVVTVIRFL